MTVPLPHLSVSLRLRMSAHPLGGRPIVNRYKGKANFGQNGGGVKKCFVIIIFSPLKTVEDDYRPPYKRSEEYRIQGEKRTRHSTYSYLV